jgi:coenzyme F420 hydrogenase subunit beta
MKGKGLLAVDELPLDSVLAMHGHMLDFKKRGTFIRMIWRQQFGQAVPDYGYAPDQIPISRRFVEIIISGIILLGHTRLARFFAENIPVKVIGPIFNVVRKTWKRISKPTKRSGLRTMTFQVNR